MSEISKARFKRQTVFWEEHSEDLRRYVQRGMTSTVTAKLLGTTRDAVTGRASRMGLRWLGLDWHRELKRDKRKATNGNEYAEWLKHKDCFPPRGYCVFPHGDPRVGKLTFCGEKAQEGMAYCTTHHKLSYYRTSRVA